MAAIWYAILACILVWCIPLLMVLGAAIGVQALVLVAAALLGVMVWNGSSRDA